MDKEYYFFAVLFVSFMLLLGYFAYGSNQRFEVCIKAGHSWIEGNCIVKGEKL